MRRFDLEEYLDNPDIKVVTRDGREVRILCTDKKSHDDSDYSVVALIPIRLGGEEIFTYNAKGERECGSDYDEDSLGLFFAPKKKEGWIKVYYGKSRCNTFVCNRIFATKEEAEKQKNDNVVAIIKIEWEE